MNHTWDPAISMGQDRNRRGPEKMTPHVQSLPVQSSHSARNTTHTANLPQAPRCSECYPSKQSPTVSTLSPTRLQLSGTIRLLLSIILLLCGLKKKTFPQNLQKPFLVSHCPEIGECVCVCVCVCVCMHTCMCVCVHVLYSLNLENVHLENV